MLLMFRCIFVHCILWKCLATLRIRQEDTKVHVKDSTISALLVIG